MTECLHLDPSRAADYGNGIGYSPDGACLCLSTGCCNDDDQDACICKGCSGPKACMCNHPRERKEEQPQFKIGDTVRLKRGGGESTAGRPEYEVRGAEGDFMWLRSAAGYWSARVHLFEKVEPFFEPGKKYRAQLPGGTMVDLWFECTDVQPGNNGEPVAFGKRYRDGREKEWTWVTRDRSQWCYWKDWKEG